MGQKASEVCIEVHLNPCKQSSVFSKLTVDAFSNHFAETLNLGAFRNVAKNELVK